MKTGGDSDEDSLFDEDDDSDDEESDEGLSYALNLSHSTIWIWHGAAYFIIPFFDAHDLYFKCHLPITDADGRPELKGRAKWLKKAVTAKDPLEDAAKKEEKKRRTDKSDKKRCS